MTKKEVKLISEAIKNVKEELERKFDYYTENLLTIIKAYED